MLRLTLRSRDDARFLARIIERDGTAFVLDYGDPTLVADASERVARGFSIFRDGRVETVSPQAPDILPLLAEFYAQEGLVVSLEEPNYAPPSLDGGPLELAPLPDIGGEDTELADDPTELVDATATLGADDDSIDLTPWQAPARTNRGALQRRALWTPPERPTGPLPLSPLPERATTGGLEDDVTEEVDEEARRKALAEAETEILLPLELDED